MSDTHLIDVGHLPVHEGEVLQTEVMPAVQSQTQLLGPLAGPDKGSNGSITVGSIERGVGFGVELHTVGTCAGSPFHHLLIGIHEDAHPYALAMEFLRNPPEEVKMCTGIPAMIAGQLVMRVGHESDLGRNHLEHQIDKVGFRVALYVEFRSKAWLEVQDILMTDMTLVGPGVYRDALCTETLAVQGHTHHVGIVGTSGVADCRHLIDIYT